MPVLDAKALETDPEGMAFLRAVLQPAAVTQGAAPPSDACAKPRRFLSVPPASDMPLGPAVNERIAAAAAA